MSLVAHFFMLTGLYLTLQAQFVAAVQVVVYAGAIMVLVVFVIMLLNVGREVQAPSARSLRPTLAMLISSILVVMVSSVIVSNPTGKNALSDKAVEIGTTASIGKALFTGYLFPFEAVSLLLLAALIGAVILAKRHVSETQS
ncbi:MAG TPA: NADH-quinone oxidoreductase subunit J [Bacteroidetes bacterium]|nr:NADH-quinone oxidoreductase subunit J [Bacteroidota bacterium]